MARPLLLALVVALVVPAAVLLIATLWRKIYNPEKSFFLCFLNVVLRPLQILRLGPFKQGKLTLDKSMKYAMKKTKLTDFGDHGFVKNYETITESDTMRAQRLTPVGYFSYRIELNMTVARRLVHVDYLKRFPQVREVAVRAPVFVLGMPRTGTTFLHRLLSLDPAVRAPLTWELLSPVPKVDATAPAVDMEKDLQRRKKFVKKLLDTRQAMGDKALQHIHEIGYDLPEECLLSLSDEIPLLLSLLYPVFAHHEAYLGLGREAFVRAYEMHKETLQMLSWQNRVAEGLKPSEEDKRWVLKCPAHLFHIKEIKTVFPDAKIIWTHRHPVSSIPSMCSLLKAIHMVYFEPDCRDDAHIGQSVARTYASTLGPMADAMASHCAEHDAQHVIYEELVRDPMAMVKKIYAQCEWPFTEEYERILLRHLAEDKAKRDEQKKQQHGKDAAALHAYSPAEYSLTEKELSEGPFAEYVQRFNIPMSKN